MMDEAAFASDRSSSESASSHDNDVVDSIDILPKGSTKALAPVQKPAQQTNGYSTPLAFLELLIAKLLSFQDSFMLLSVKFSKLLLQLGIAKLPEKLQLLFSN